MEPEQFNAQSLKRNRPTLFGMDAGAFIKAFFGGNASVAILVLALITVFLFREGVEFFPQNQRSMQLYRASGQEFVSLLRSEVTEFTALQQQLNRVQTGLLTKLYDQGKEFDEVNRTAAPFRRYVNSVQATVRPLKSILDKASAVATEAKDKVVLNETRRGTPGVNPAELMSPEAVDRYLADTRKAVFALMPEVEAAHKALQEGLTQALDRIPRVADPEAAAALDTFAAAARAFLANIPDFQHKLEVYDPARRVTLPESIGSFLFGKEWITNSSWQDFYGIWPLLSGSLLVTTVALIFAIPLGICAAIYVNQIAVSREQNLIKPYIEFISAIPSVVIGFFGIAVFGTTVRWLSEQDWLSWVPFFPLSERLNAFTAGGLLALMAVPTIFTLAEDALNNVPRSYREASVALGATQWQTICRIIVPTALSGMISAVLLGFGRVIGETMVVLLCAGNRIAIPDFSQGLGAFFEPVHTMTGIIAQEMGEVVPGSIHYRALFCVGIFLFFLSLLINYLAQLIVRKFKISAG